MRAAISILLAAPLLLATSTTQSPSRLYEQGDYAAAVALLERPDGLANASDLELLGQCYYMLGNFRKATDVLERAATAAPNDSMIQTWLGRAWGMRAESAFPLAAIGQAGKSRDAFERAVRLDEENQEALGDLFDFYMEAPGIVGGGLQKAESLLPRYAQHDPLGFHIARARVAEKRQQYSAAETSFRKAIDVSPQTLSLRLELAQFLARRGRYDESERVFQQAADIAPDSPAILFSRASSYIKTDRNIERARELLKQYIALPRIGPHLPQRWEAQKLLRKAEGI